MGNVLRVFARDMKRLAKTPAAWVVALALIVLPSLYAWINVYGFWNPYDNTQALRVCVVNEDQGARDDKLGKLDLGAQIVDDLRENDQMGWAFVDRDEAMEEIRAGKAYAAFVIPPEFSKDVAALASGSLEQAKLEYYVNEKAGPVSPKIMDTGANTLDNTINSAFVSQVSETVVQALGGKASELKTKVEAAANGAHKRVEKAIASLGDIRESLQTLSAAATDAQDRAAGARDSLADEKDSLVALSDDLASAAQLVGDANESASRLSLELGNALDSGSSALSLASSQTNQAISATAAKVTGAKGHVDAALNTISGVVSEQDQVIATLQAIEDVLPEGDVKSSLADRIESMTAVNDEAKLLLQDLETLSGDIANTATSVATASDAVNTATQDALSIGSGYRQSVNDDTLPAVSSGVSAISVASAELSATAGSLTALVDQASGALAQLETTLGQSAHAFGQTDSLLKDAQDELSSIQADLGALSRADSLRQLLGTDIDAKKVASFMMAPTTVKSEQLYPLNAYGSAMAPLFINLTLWIGVFMLMVIMRIEVDEEGAEDSTVAQRFLGRQMLLACMAGLQAIVCCVGCLLIGVQVASLPLFVLTAVIASLSYLAIQYSLSSTFQHLGKALCLILVFVQIPGATGLYPIEMTTDFFRNTYPLFPFTYGINAIRETVFGLYGNLWVGYIGVLIAFMAVFTAFGALARPLTANLNRLFEQQIEETDLVNIEPVQLPDRRYKVSQLISVLSGREEYRLEMETRSRQFMQNYPRYKHGALAAGIVLPLVITPIFIATGIDKVIILTSWLILLIAIAAFLVIVEYIRDNLLHQVALTDLSEPEISKLYFGGNSSGRRHRVDFQRAKLFRKFGRTAEEQDVNCDSDNDVAEDVPDKAGDTSDEEVRQ